MYVYELTKFTGRVRALNNENSINDDKIVFFNTDEIVETKSKVIEYPSTIVIDRPNTMKLVNKQCLFSLQIRFSYLPLTIEAVGNQNSVFRFYVNFGTEYPDNSGFDRKFEDSSFTITEDMLRSILKQMLSDPQKRFLGSQILKGQNLSKSHSKQLKEMRSTNSYFKRTSMRENTDASLIGKTSEGSFVSHAFLTSTGDLTSDRRDVAYQLDEDDEEIDCSEALFNITVRCYSNTPKILLTASISKNNVKKKKTHKNVDLFSAEAKEELKKAMLKNTEIQKKLLGFTKSSGFRTSRTQYKSLLNREPSTSKINLNKIIAKNYQSHRLEHMKTLESKPIEVAYHVNKAKLIKQMLKEEMSKKIENEYSKRLYLRRTREARESRKRLIAFQLRSITFLKLFTCLRVMKDMYWALREVKIKEKMMNKCASLIQKEWENYCDNALPRFRRQRRFLDCMFVARSLARLNSDKVQARAKKEIGVYMAHCFVQVKLKTSFYQCSLYSRFDINKAANIQRRYRCYAMNQRLNLMVLRKIWDKEHSVLVRIESRDKTMPILNSMTQRLAGVSE